MNNARKNSGNYGQSRNDVTNISDYERERAIQLEHGRKILSLNKDKESVTKMQVSRQNERGGNKKNFSNKRESKIGHEACLAHVVAERRMAKVLFADGTTLSGEVLEFDKYSIRLRSPDGVSGWFFKSAMKGFCEEDK